MFKIRNCLYIISNEDKLNVPMFFRVLKKDEHHLKYMQEFSDTYNLGYKFANDDNNIAPVMLTLDGNLVVKTSFEYMKMAIFYIPELVTNRQKEWLDNNIRRFENCDYVGFSNISLLENGKLREERVENIEQEIDIIKKRNENYLTKRGDKMLKGKVVIIPDEDQILQDEFVEEILEGDNHVSAYQKFSIDNNLGLIFGEDEGHMAALETADLGHFNYKTFEDLGIITFYIPKKVTNRQLDYFTTHKSDYEDYGTIGGYTIRKMDDNIFTDEIYGVDEIEQEMIKRNKAYEEEKGHVR